MNESSILYQNALRTVFLLDIPTSITLAQDLTQTQQQYSPEPKPPIATPTPTKKRHLLSTTPLKEPYPSPPEPKTHAARARLLERIPFVEREFHANLIEPLVRGGLHEIRECYSNGDGDGDGREWCLERFTVDDGGGESRKRERALDNVHSDGYEAGIAQPPVILSPTCVNCFGTMIELGNVVVKNTSLQPASLVVPSDLSGEEHRQSRVFTVPALSNFLFCMLSTSRPYTEDLNPIPGLPQSQKFNLILLDPPWPNRSVRRSRHYQTQAYFDMDELSRFIRDILQVHLLDTKFPPESAAQSKESIAAIWVTNAEKSRKAAYDAIADAGLSVCEEWVWVKTTTNGESITPVVGLWRKPYEILIIGKREEDTFPRGNSEVTRRVIAAVPDVHSRKPNLKELFESVFFGVCTYKALEVFARNLTAGWWAVGNEVLKFNEEEWWFTE